MKNTLKTFQPNALGRDFVIGDLHGSMAVLENLLYNLKFDKSIDRMFSVGDLVDRGAESLRALGLIREPWFHVVLSNHEQMMLEAFNGGYMGNFWLRNGGTWGMETLNVAESLANGEKELLFTDDDYELLDLLTLVEELPYLITVNHKSGKKFHILHAELPARQTGITDSVLSSPDKVKELAMRVNNGGDAFLWSRRQFMPFYRANLENRAKLIRMVKNYCSADMYNDELSHIISGHTIVQNPITLFNQTNIDTCAYGSGDYKWCALTCINLDTWEFFQATQTEFRQVTPLVINHSDIGALENSDK